MGRVSVPGGWRTHTHSSAGLMQQYPRTAPHLHHDHRQRQRHARHAAHERARADERKRARVDPGPGRGRQEHARRRAVRRAGRLGGAGQSREGAGEEQEAEGEEGKARLEVQGSGRSGACHACMRWRHVRVAGRCNTAQRGAHPPSTPPHPPLRSQAVRRRDVHGGQAHQAPDAGADEQHRHKHARADGAAGCGRAGAEAEGSRHGNVCEGEPRREAAHPAAAAPKPD